MSQPNLAYYGSELFSWNPWNEYLNYDYRITNPNDPCYPVPYYGCGTRVSGDVPQMFNFGGQTNSTDASDRFGTMALVVAGLVIGMLIFRK